MGALLEGGHVALQVGIWQFAVVLQQSKSGQWVWQQTIAFLLF